MRHPLFRTTSFAHCVPSFVINVLPPEGIDLAQCGSKRKTPAKVRAHLFTPALDVGDVSQPFEVMKGPLRITDLFMNAQCAEEVLLRLQSLFLRKSTMLGISEYVGNHAHHVSIPGKHLARLYVEFFGKSDGQV